MGVLSNIVCIFVPMLLKINWFIREIYEYLKRERVQGLKLINCLYILLSVTQNKWINKKTNILCSEGIKLTETGVKYSHATTGYQSSFAELIVQILWIIRRWKFQRRFIEFKTFSAQINQWIYSESKLRRSVDDELERFFLFYSAIPRRKNEWIEYLKI